MRSKASRVPPFRVAALIGCIAGCLALPARSATDAASQVTNAKAQAEKGDLRGAVIELRNAERANPADAETHVELGELYLKLHNYPAAEAEANLAKQHDANDDDVAPILAEALAREGKITKLFQEIQPGSRTDRAESRVRLVLGEAHLALGETKDAEPLLRDAAQLDPNAPAPKLALVRFAMLTGDIAGTKTQLDAALALAPNDIETQRLSGEYLRATGDSAGALAAYGKILAKDPDDPATLLSRANILIEQNKLAEAQSDVGHALKIAPKDIAARYTDAVVLARQGHYDKADDILDKLALDFPSLPKGYFLQGAVKYALGQYAQAADSLRKYLAHNSGDPAASRILAAIALRQNESDRAIALLKPIADANPTDGPTINLLFRAYIAAGQQTEAEQLYQRAGQQKPGDEGAQLGAALAQIALGNPATGNDQLEKIANTQQGADAAGPLLVYMDLQKGDIAQADEAAKDLIKRSPDDILALNAMGVVRDKEDRLADAAAIFQDIIKRNSQFYPARRSLAEVLREMDRPADAKQAWLDLLKLDPDDEAALMGLAQLAFEQKDMSEAVARLKTAQAQVPKDPTPSLRLIDVYTAQKDWASALDVAQKLQVQFPFNPQITGIVADLRTQSGDQKGAAAEFSSLVQHNPNSAPLYERYALYQRNAGDKLGARSSLEKAIELAPGNFQFMAELVRVDFGERGADAALKTAKSFAAAQPAISDLLTARVLVDAKRTPEAIETLTQAEQAHPTSAIVIELADLTYATGKRDEGKVILSSWLAQHDDDIATRVALANLYMVEHDNDKAQAEFEQVRQKAPNNSLALANLAWIYASKADPRARDLALEAFRAAPSAQTADTLGWIMLGQGAMQRALDYLRQASAEAPNDPEIGYHFAAALRATGDEDGARKLLEKVLKSGSEFDGKQDAQKLLTELDHS